MAPKTSSRGASWLTALLLLPVLGLFGILIGGLVATRAFPTSGMGWDQIAQALGGVMVGGIISIAVWIVAIRALGTTGRLVLIAVALLGSAGVWMYLLTTPKPERVPSQSVENVPPPPVASFSFQLGAADGLEGPRPGAQRLPWQTLRIASNLSFDYVPLDRPNQLCLAVDVLNTPTGIAQLTALRDVLSRQPQNIDCGEPCPACDEVSLQWSLDDERSTLSITDRCWLTHEQLQPLRAAVDAIVTPHREHATCETMGD